MAIPLASHLDGQGVAKLINTPDPTAPQDAATKAYVDSVIEGLNWKDSVRVAASSNITVASPGATVDGITMVAGDRVLLKNQTTGAENGIYVWNGAAVPMTRALDMNTAAEVEQAITNVEEGTSASTSWRQTAVNVTLGTTPLVWTTMGTVAPPASETTAGIVELATQAEVDAGTDTTRAITPATFKNSSLAKKFYTTLFGDGTTLSYVINHGLGTKNVHVQVFEEGGSFREVKVEVQHTSTSQVTLVYLIAPASNAHRVVVLG